MTKIVGRRIGGMHDDCTTRSPGRLVMQTKEVHAGYSQEGMAGHVYATVLDYLYCDTCFQVFVAEQRGMTLADISDSQRAVGFQNPATKPAHCSRCSKEDSHLTEIYVKNTCDVTGPGGVFNSQYGVTYLICGHCGILAWYHDHAADRRAEAEDSAKILLKDADLTGTNPWQR